MEVRLHTQDLTENCHTHKLAITGCNTILSGYYMLGCIAHNAFSDICSIQKKCP